MSYQELQQSATKSIQSKSVTHNDWPIRGVGFLDISPLFLSNKDFDNVLSYWQHRFQGVDLVVGLEARGFILGSAFGQKCSLPFMMMRKKGKLPGTLLSEAYCKEYGRDEMEIQENILSYLPNGTIPKDRPLHVLIVDDVLATGGTICASIELTRKLLLIHNVKNFKISTAIISAIKSLNGKEKIYEKYNDVNIDVILDI
ncbi:adenine phosphoribosyltransferase [Tieghemostelium lacteum]|uniref:adenine phosphoribosyltransferase n=1 Tax=Tieghemostelium lacteum TaxID=361077 RepID=A0A152A448_TIELA|nr:adenine phosphoribosyltransferase [Tieghemostelium lacteum]|eukprot:KYR00831.1 adenine phosphoribosyltransferase [Tieghemostelium lacteum]